MIINGINQIDFKVLNSKVTPLKTQDNDEFGILELKLYVSDKTKDNLNLKISNLVKELKNCVIKLDNSFNEFVGSINGDPNISPITGLNYEINISVKGYSRGLMETYTTDSNNYKIFIKGNRECGIRISYTATINHISLDLCGYQIKNIKKNDFIILDGIKNKVTKNDVNCFLDTNIFEFPSLKPGENVLVSDVFDIKIEYYPLYY